MWNSKDVDKLQIICLPIDKTLRTIRSLEFKDIPLLKHMKKVTCKIIKEKYGVDECYIKKFFHYEPSTYHLHIHFINIANVECQSSVEYSHEIDSVIFNLFICSNYYKQVVMNKRI
jgi:m7GpppX diphosphatase